MTLTAMQCSAKLGCHCRKYHGFHIVGKDSRRRMISPMRYETQAEAQSRCAELSSRLK